ncbi:OLC1v1037287C2 [Oldenlandia corymbosa var. corymbosa]|nr:OLC1v1037287C2 [Oldenlandia corymbosa var. corymbosa]
MQKQRECPEEFREPVASLMFAAARFSDLPELRDLRDLFQERYGSSLQSYVNQKFVDLLSSKPPSFEKRLQLLKDITSEFSIKWDSRGFEQRMASPSPVAQAPSPKHEPSRVAVDEFHVVDGIGGVSKPDKHKGMWGLGKDGYNMQNGRECENLGRKELGYILNARKERSSKGHIFPTEKEKKGESTTKRGNDENLLEARQEVIVDEPKNSSKKDDSLLRVVKVGSPSHRKHENNFGSRNSSQENGISIIQPDEKLRALSHRKNGVSPHREVLLGENDDISYAREHVRKNNLTSLKRIDTEEKEDRSKFHHNALLPPPYVKPKNSVPPYVKSKDKHKSVTKSEQGGSDHNGCLAEPESYNTANEQNGSHSIQKKQNSVGDHGQLVGPATLDHVHQTELYYQDDHNLRKQRSSRRKHHKSSSVVHSEEAGALKRSSRRRDSSRKGLQTLLDDEHSAKYDDERVIDKLLLHYSKKPSTCDVKTLRKELQANRHHDAGESSHARKSEGSHLSLDENIATPTRSKSLPREETFSAEHKKIYTRANSFQPDGQAKHVHPKLPNYDDLAARFAALKGL